MKIMLCLSDYYFFFLFFSKDNLFLESHKIRPVRLAGKTADADADTDLL